MRITRAALAAGVAMLVQVGLSAGQIYGTIVADGKGLKEVAVEIQCSVRVQALDPV